MKFIANRTVSQPLNEVKNFKPNNRWEKFEVMTVGDKFAVAILKKVKRKMDDNAMWKKFRPRAPTIFGVGD